MKTYSNPNLFLTVQKIGNINDVVTLEPPAPPSGSDVDQTTLSYTADSAYIVAGGYEDDPAQEHYCNQGFRNNREGITGFGVIAGCIGNVTEPLAVGLVTDEQRRNDPQNQNGTWLAQGSISASQIDPNYWYYIAVTLDGPIYLPQNETVYIVLATNQHYYEDPNTTWLWQGMSNKPYSYPFDVWLGGTDWVEDVFSAKFWTWTLLGNGVPCSSHTTQTACQNAECYWYDNSCHSSPQNGNGTPTNCEGYTTKTSCESADCHWYAYPNPIGDPSCHSQEMMMAYLPFILAGVGGLIVIMAIAKR